MKFRPILFSTEMVKALLDGRKSQTRRIIKPKYSNTDICRKQDKYGKRLIERQNDVPPNVITDLGDGKTSTMRHLVAIRDIPVKYRVGDVLWVRETFGIIQPTHATPGGRPYDGSFVYRADGDDNPSWAEGTFEFSGWKPSVHMPKSACRIFLKIEDIRVERLQDISADDAHHEGIESHGAEGGPGAYRDYVLGGWVRNPVFSFQTLWEKINDADSWKANPWTWAISFTRIDKPENF